MDTDQQGSTSAKWGAALSRAGQAGQKLFFSHFELARLDARRDSSRYVKLAISALLILMPIFSGWCMLTGGVILLLNTIYTLWASFLIVGAAELILGALVFYSLIKRFEQSSTSEAKEYEYARTIA